MGLLVEESVKFTASGAGPETGDPLNAAVGGIITNEADTVQGEVIGAVV